MQTPSVDQLVGQVLGNYRLERFLGKGRLNAVYLARELTSQRTDALALYLIPERFSIDARDIFLMRFRKEAAAITTLDHPHILPVYAYGEYGSYPYLVTPYMTQGSLADVLKRKGRCEHAFVLPILEQLVAGISYAHGKGFIHGTLKPANVLLVTEDTMQVAGFGLMHMLQQRGIEPNAQSYTHLLSIADTFLAAPEYIAPEVVQGQAVDMRSDIYSLGCILFELLSGQPPFHGEKPLEVAGQHVTQTIPSLRKLAPDVPIALSSVVHQALERDPAQRFQNVAELGEAFAQASSGATSYQKQRVGGSTGEASRMYAGQDTPQGGYTAGNWQLKPPVATGQIQAIKVPRPAAQSSRTPTGTPDNWQLLPPIVTGRMPALKSSPAASAPPTLPPLVPQELPPPSWSAPVVQQSPAKPLTTPVPQKNPAKVQSETGNSMPGTNADTSDLVKAYEWWSLSDQVQEAPSTPAPVPASENGRRLPIENEVDWSAEPMPLETTGRRKKQKQGPQKIQRRKVLAFVAAGGVAAAGAAVFLNFGHILGTPVAKTSSQKNAPAQAPQQQANGKSAVQPPNQQPNKPAPTNNPAPSQNGQMNMQDAPAANNGNSIGSTKQMGNSSAEFTNPADKKMALLIHLSTGSFAAYERACTHEGVSVNYDPATKMLICPAHGAIFDPAKNGSVVQGPADQPLPTVHIKVNGDGTITAV